MKRYSLTAFAMALCLALCACGAAATASSAAADASQPDSEPAETGLEIPTEFDYSALFDENGYVAGVTAADYVTLPEDFAALTLPAGTDTVSDEDLEALISEQVLSYYATETQITDRAAEMGDTVNIDYVGSVDGVEFSGGSTGGNGTVLQLTGTNYIDDFEEQIAGHMPGDTFNVEVTFPDPYPDEENNNPDLAGKDAVFVTTLHYIVGEPIVPELTDDFVEENLAATTGWNTAQEVRDYFHDALLFNKQSSAIYDLLDAGVQYGEALPPDVQDFFEQYALYSVYLTSLQYGLSSTDPAELLPQYGYDSTEQYLEDMQQNILSNGQTVLLVQAMAEELGIVCDDDALAQKAETVFGTSDLSDYEEHYGKEYLKMLALERLVMDDLIRTATVAAE